ncbi:TPA: ead/Ea22-like family protein [Klebsiella quasipneumoniae subsp. similipneumoniae]
MTTDITELALSLKSAAEKATPGRIGDRIDGSGSIKYECHGYDGSLVLRTDHKNMEYGFIGDNSLADEEFFRACVPDAIIALVEALEKAQRANAAQDDHINQQQDRIESLEKKNAELGKYAGELESFRTAYMEWSDKTDWVQKDKRFDFLKPWGKHRADVLKEYIQHLESRTVKLPEPFELAKVSGGLSYYYADEVDAALIVAGIKVEAE